MRSVPEDAVSMFVAVTLARRAMHSFAPIGPHTIPAHGILHNAKRGTAEDVVRNFPGDFLDAVNIILSNAGERHIHGSMTLWSFLVIAIASVMILVNPELHTSGKKEVTDDGAAEHSMKNIAKSFLKAEGSSHMEKYILLTVKKIKLYQNLAYSTNSRVVF